MLGEVTIHEMMVSNGLALTLFLLSFTNIANLQGCCDDAKWYVIRSTEKSGLVLDGTLAGWVRVEHYTGFRPQLWKFEPSDKPGFFFIVNDYHRKVLDFVLADDGYLQLVLTDWNGSLQQQWQFTANGRIANAANGKNADVFKMNFFAGNRVVVFEDNGCTCQEFYYQQKL